MPPDAWPTQPEEGKPCRPTSEADVIAHCRKELTGCKVPKQVRFVDALPKSTVGKILRRDLCDVK